MDAPSSVLFTPLGVVPFCSHSCPLAGLYREENGELVDAPPFCSYFCPHSDQKCEDFGRGPQRPSGCGCSGALRACGGSDTGWMEFLDPRGVPSRPVDPYELSAELDEGTTVALFANGFPDSVEFLQHVEKALSHELPGVNFLHINKGNASALATEADLSTIADSCSAVVAAYGH